MGKILIIDDDLDIVDSLTMILEAGGHQVSAKASTENLVGDVMEVNPGLIILDVIFPEDPQAGFTAARTLSRNEKVRTLPILMLSAVNQSSNMAFSFSESDISADFMPVKGFLEKPVDPAVLLEKVRALLGE